MITGYNADCGAGQLGCMAADTKENGLLETMKFIHFTLCMNKECKMNLLSHSAIISNLQVLHLRIHKDFYFINIPRSVRLQRFLELIARLTMVVVLMHAVARDWMGSVHVLMIAGKQAQVILVDVLSRQIKLIYDAIKIVWKPTSQNVLQKDSSFSGSSFNVSQVWTSPQLNQFKCVCPMFEHICEQLFEQFNSMKRLDCPTNSSQVYRISTSLILPAQKMPFHLHTNRL